MCKKTDSTLIQLSTKDKEHIFLMPSEKQRKVNGMDDDILHKRIKMFRNWWCGYDAFWFKFSNKYGRFLIFRTCILQADSTVQFIKISLNERYLYFETNIFTKLSQIVFLINISFLYIKIQLQLCIVVGSLKNYVFLQYYILIFTKLSEIVHTNTYLTYHFIVYFILFNFCLRELL